jgi:hypothetical protein
MLNLMTLPVRGLERWTVFLYVAGLLAAHPYFKKSPRIGLNVSIKIPSSRQTHP